MTPADQRNLAAVHAFLAALAANSGEGLHADFFTPDVEQVELPNKLNPNGAVSNLAELQRRAKLARHLIRRQSYEVASEMTRGDRVVIEAQWTAELAVPMGTLEPGSRMKAHFAMFFELRDGLIHRMRNYDCFEPW